MISIFELNKKIKSQSISNIIDELINNIYKDKFIEKIQELQYDKGEDSQGDIFGFYSIGTQIITNGRKIAGQPYNLFDTGKFREGLYIDVHKQQYDIFIEISSIDNKTNLLEYKFGDTLFGIQEKNINLITNNTNKILIQILNDIIK